MKLSLSVFTILTLLVSSQFSSSALAANPGFIVVNELASSPSHITAMRNTAVWLHWNYTYGGDIAMSTYKEQIIGCNSSSQPFKSLARRTGANGALTVESALPSEFSGRIEVMPSNSTLVIKSLNLNDSSFSFSSFVVLTMRFAGDVRANLKPAVRIMVLVKLDADPKLEAGKIADQRCVEVKWKRAESGLCFVKYEVKFKNASGDIIYNEIGYNIDSKKKCSIPEKINITNVDMTMRFKTSTKTTTVKVSENPIPTTAAPTTSQTTSSTTGPTSSQSRTTAYSTWTDISSSQQKTQVFKCQQKACNSKTWAMVGNFFGGFFLGLSLAFLGGCISTRRKEKKKKGKACNIHNKTSDNSTNEMHYMDLREREEQPVYEGLAANRSQHHQNAIFQKTQDESMPSHSIQQATNNANEFHYMDLKDCREKTVYTTLGANTFPSKRFQKDQVYENSPAKI